MTSVMEANAEALFTNRSLEEIDPRGGGSNETGGE